MAVTIAQESAASERACQALRKSEAFLRSVFNSLATLIAVLDRGGRIVAVNQAWRSNLQVYGLAADAYCEGADYLAVCDRAEGPDADMARSVAAGIRAVIAGLEPEFRFEYLCHGATEPHWFEVKVRPLHDNEQANVVISHEEITERKVGEERWRNNARMLDMTTHIARVGGWQSDLGSDRVFWSDELCRILKQPPGTRVSVADGIRVYAPEWQARMRNTFIACAWGGEPFDEEAEIINGDGERVWVRSMGQAIRNDAGAIVGVQGVLKDIALQRAAEARLRQLSQAIEQRPESIMITDLDANIEYVNEAFTRISGYAAHELLGRNSSMLGTGETPAHTQGAMWATLLRGQPWQGEFNNRRKDGTRYTEYAVIGPLRDADSQIKHYVATKIDITNYKRIDQELAEHREHLEHLVGERTAELAEARKLADAANLAKSAFLANMSHEIRTPMNGVLGLLEVLAQSDLDAHQTDLVATISESGNALLGIIDDILDFSKIEAGRLDLDPAPLSIAELVEGLCDTLVPLAMRKQVDLCVFIDPTIPAQVSGDGLRLRQVLYNLLGNAVKFSGDRYDLRGQVSLRVTPATQDPLRLAFTLRDNGVGMDSETQTRLFTPFTQAESSTTRRYGGTGLGLSICRRLVELMGGTIALESQPQLGSTFTVTIPFDVVAQTQSEVLGELAGVTCLVLVEHEGEAGDLGVYLEHAGAAVLRIAETADVKDAASGRDGPLVVIRRMDQAQALPSGPLRAAPDVGQVLITRGRRRRPRSSDNGLVIVDGSALRRHSLIRAVLLAAGLADEVPTPDSTDGLATPLQAPPTVTEARGRGQLVLVAEDDAVNQKVILQQLALLGCAAEVAENGAEALRLWRAGGHALLLTDMHMPEMDGLSLTQAIRQAENDAGCLAQARLPIVALTANALRGEAESARAAGMNDYLTKPLKLAELRRVIATLGLDATASVATKPLTESRSVSAAAAQSRASTSVKPVYDPGVLPALVGEVPAIIRELLEEFLLAAARYEEELHVAAARAASADIASIAHRLKASAGAVGALALGEVAARTEDAARRNDGTLPDLLALLDAALFAATTTLTTAVADFPHLRNTGKESSDE